MISWPWLSFTHFSFFTALFSSITCNQGSHVMNRLDYAVLGLGRLTDLG